jgi:GntR family transcriptional regulator, transcriptional repressor for pyruvate dehydrogenase complex
MIAPMSDTRTASRGRSSPSQQDGQRPVRRRLTIGQAAPLVRLNTYELIAERLLDDIASGAMPVGTPIPGELELAESLRVGRSSVREALRVLESRGLIARSGSGRFRVAEHGNPIANALSVLYDLHRVQIRELFELRATIEIDAAAVASARRSTSDLKALAETLGAMQWGSSTADELHIADTRFHVVIAEASGNFATARVVEGLRLVVYSVLHGPLFTRTGTGDWSSKTVGEHIQIANAISAQDATEAADAMRRHLTRVSEQSLELLGREVAADDEQT